jgi:hypothetical protein
MADGEWWMVVRRHEMTQLATRATVRERELYLFFHGPRGALRRATVAPDFPDDASDDAVRDAWIGATVLDAGGPARGEPY